jgi:hypothetical protein
MTLLAVMAVFYVAELSVDLNIRLQNLEISSNFKHASQATLLLAFAPKLANHGTSMFSEKEM